METALVHLNNSNDDGTIMTVRIPPDAISGVLAVRFGDSRSSVLSFAQSFTLILPNITLTDFDPEQQHYNQVVTITGTGFSSNAGDNEVAFGNDEFVGASEVNDARTAIKVVVPLVLSTPAIADFSPASGSPGTTVTITDTGFSPTVSQDSIAFGNDVFVAATSVQVDGNDSDTLIVQVSVAARTGNIQVKTRSGSHIVSTDVFTVTVLPPLLSPQPNLVLTFILILLQIGYILLTFHQGFIAVTSMLLRVQK